MIHFSGKLRVPVDSGIYDNFAKCIKKIYAPKTIRNIKGDLSGYTFSFQTHEL